jgi:hypothetical protein
MNTRAAWVQAREELRMRILELEHFGHECTGDQPATRRHIREITLRLLRAVDAGNLAELPSALEALAAAYRELRDPASRRQGVRLVLGALAATRLLSHIPVPRSPADDASRRVRWAIHLAVRLLPPEDRRRYREEFAAEFASLPRCDQAAYAYRLITRTWALRRALAGQPRRRALAHRPRRRRGLLTLTLATGPASALATTIDGILTGSGSAILAAVGLLIVTGILAAWTIGSDERTNRLATLVRAARGEEPSGHSGKRTGRRR